VISPDPGEMTEFLRANHMMITCNAHDCTLDTDWTSAAPAHPAMINRDEAS
jgi:hypothetical protein